MKKALPIIAALVLIAACAYASGGKIAYFDVQTVFNKTILGKKYQVIERGYYESRKKILDTDADEIQKLREDYSKQKLAKLNGSTQREKEEELSRKVAEFEKIRAEFSNEIGKKNEELSAEFNRQVLDVLKNLAKRERLSLILNRTISMPNLEVQSVAYADQDLDITDEIIVEMNKKEEVMK